MAELAGLLLAAGGSRRLGRPKQLLRLGGVPLVRRQAEALAHLADSVLVVTGADGERVSAALDALPVSLLRNPAWRAGMGGSLAAGVAALPASADAVLVLLCDQYRVGATELAGLREAWLEQPLRIVAACWDGLCGPPAIFPRHRFPALEALRGEGGARSLLRAAGADLIRFDCPAAAHDLDTGEDLEDFRRYGEGGSSR